MPVVIDWGIKDIQVPQSYLTLVGGTLYSMDTDAFRLDLKNLEDSEEGISHPDTHRHNTEVTVGGVTYARVVEIINGYTVTFEDVGSQYSVRLEGSNNNIWDIQSGILAQNNVQVIPTNSAGLVRVDTPGKPTEAHISVAYDGATLDLGVWLVRLGSTVLNPTSAMVVWHTGAGIMLFTINDSNPDAKGYFHFSRSQVLTDDDVYYADVTVVDSQGTITTRRGISTVATA